MSSGVESPPLDSLIGHSLPACTQPLTPSKGNEYKSSIHLLYLGPSQMAVYPDILMCPPGHYDRCTSVDVE